MFDDKQINIIKKIVDEAVRKLPRIRIVQSDIPPQTIKRRHIEDVVVVFGVAADRPTDGDEFGVRAYFSTDSGVFACWDGTQWLETTLT